MNYNDFYNEWQNDEDFIVCHTSGSTGAPKEIRLGKDFVSASAKRTIDFFGLNPSSRLYSCVSPDYIGGKMMGVRSYICGARLEYETPSNRPVLGTDPIDLLAAVPSQMEFICDNISDYPAIHNVIVGGAPVSELLAEKIERTGIRAFETYGMTETASHIALRRITSLPRHFICLDGITVSLQNECLIIHLPGCKPIVTNDLAKVYSDREFDIYGRADNAIISGGIKVHPEIVEQKLSDIIRCPYMISSRPNEKWGEAVILLMEKGDETDKSEIEALHNLCRTRLKGAEMPKDIISVDNLPRTPNGKLRREKFYQK